MSNLHYFYNFWDYWNLRHKVTFDGVNKLILINEGETNINVQSDIYSDWKEWVRTEDNLKYLEPLSTVGGEPTIEGQRLDVTFFLINGWKIKPYSGTYDLTLDGNIFDVDGGSIKVPADVQFGNPNNITINRNGLNIEGAAADFTINVNRSGVECVYSDATQGWILIDLT